MKYRITVENGLIVDDVTASLTNIRKIAAPLFPKHEVPLAIGQNFSLSFKLFGNGRALKSKNTNCEIANFRL